MTDRQKPASRNAFRVFRPITTRWMDNDAYGHVNNVVYYSFFDTAVNALLVERGLLDIASSPVVALVAETGCRYFESIAFPEPIEAGLSVTRLGRSSVTYALGIFRTDSPCAVAQGHFVHVYVDRATQRPMRMPDRVRSVLTELFVAPDADDLRPME
jgi:acyl-CoA thioester hydrolase